MGRRHRATGHTKPVTKIFGIKEIDKKLKRLTPKLGKKIVRKALRAGCAPIKEEAKTRCPVDTGRLRNSISIKIKAGARSRKKLEVMVTTSESTMAMTVGDAWYGAVVEFGAPNRPSYTAKAFLRPSLDQKRNEARGIAINKTQELIESELNR